VCGGVAVLPCCTATALICSLRDKLGLQELWDIAQTLRRQSVLRAKYAEARRGVTMTPELEAVLAPKGKLSRAVEAVTRRTVGTQRPSDEAARRLAIVLTSSR
jgi:hypothetical protein